MKIFCESILFKTTTCWGGNKERDMTTPVDVIDLRLSRVESFLAGGSVESSERALDQIEMQAAALSHRAPSLMELLEMFPRPFELGSASPASQAVILHASIDRVQDQVRQLESVSQSRDCLSLETLASIPQMQARLVRLASTNLSSLALEQQRAVFALLTRYDQLVQQISHQFLLWDQLITEMEQRSGSAISAFLS